jgi:hypothetical protein
MSGLLRRLPELLGRLVTGALLTTRAMADAVFDFDEAIPLAVANNVPDPQLKLAGAIIILFAGCLSILVVGYIVDSTRPQEAPVCQG